MSELEGESEPLTVPEPETEADSVTDPVTDTLADSLPVAEALRDTPPLSLGEGVCEENREPVDESEGVPDTDALPEELPVTDVEDVTVVHAETDVVEEGEEDGEQDADIDGELLGEPLGELAPLTLVEPECVALTEDDTLSELVSECVVVSDALVEGEGDVELGTDGL